MDRERNADHLEKTARGLIAADADETRLATLLKRSCPAIARQIQKDGGNPDLLALWGKCVNVDENTNQTIVAPQVLDAIGALASVSMRGKAIHAGLQHTYGYLFSLIETPYGNKRDRWTSSSLERRFDLPDGLLSPLPPAGTLLANVTWLIGQVAFRAQPKDLAKLSRISNLVAPGLLKHAIPETHIERAVEQVAFGPYTARTATLHTDLVRFPVMLSDREEFARLLIYSVRSGATSVKLITTFPVSEAGLQAIRSAPSGMAEIRLRFNAYLAGLYGKVLPGNRCFYPVRRGERS